jgi:hypothetical protein
VDQLVHDICSPCSDNSVCKQRRAKYKVYRTALDQVNIDVLANLDLVNFTRELRMHGYAISILLVPAMIQAITTFAKTKPIDSNHSSQKYTKREQFYFGLLKK